MQIVTNSLPIANLFASSRETDLVILGGYVYPQTGVALGPLTVRMMEDIHVHQTILSVGGMTEGLFNSNLLLVETERQMMRCADEVVVVADHTKIGRTPGVSCATCRRGHADRRSPALPPEQSRLLEQAERAARRGDGGKRAEELRRMSTARYWTAAPSNAWCGEALACQAASKAASANG